MKVVSWDANAINDTTNYTAGLMEGEVQSLPGMEVEFAPRSDAWPLVSNLVRPGRLLFLTVEIKGASAATLRKQLHQWFDPEDETAKQLVIDDDAGTNDRYVNAVCERFEDTSKGAGVGYVATLRVHGDVRWRLATVSTDNWSATTDSATHTKSVTNSGADDAYPVISITPTLAKSVGFSARRQIAIRWQGYPFSMYPIDIVNQSFDGAAAIASTDMDTDGNQARVYVNGVEVDRWIDGINDTDTSIWTNLDFEGPHEGLLGTAIASSDVTITEIALSSVTYGMMKTFPVAGRLRINAEEFTYTARSIQQMKFTGITREARGTSRASHAVGDTVWWVQHDIALYYSDSDLGAPTQDDDYQPIMTLASSSNGSWDYDNFGIDHGKRTGAWTFVDYTDSNVKYTANQGSDASGLSVAWSEMGIKQNIIGSGPSQAQWEIFHPCRITNANFANGEKRHDSFSTDVWTASIRSKIQQFPLSPAWTTEDSIAVPTTDGAWEAWSDNEAITAESAYVAMYLERAAGIPTAADQQLEVSDVTLTLDTDYMPVVTVGAEEAIYPLYIRIKNTTTSDWIDVKFNMEVNQTLELDTYDKTVLYLKDNSNQFQALTLVGGPRKDWLKLAPGANTLTLSDLTQAAGTGVEIGALTIGIEWEQRDYT